MADDKDKSSAAAPAKTETVAAPAAPRYESRVASANEANNKVPDDPKLRNKPEASAVQ